MRWRIVAVGKPRLNHAREAVADYAKRLCAFAQVESEVVKSNDPQREGTALLARSEGCFRVVLDERGRQFTSRAFSEEVRKMAEHPAKTHALLVGGANGLSDKVRDEANLLWSLGTLTFQHEMALALALEQVYRAHTILKGLPYHRD